MEYTSPHEAEDPRERELQIDVLRSMLSIESIGNLDIDDELRVLRSYDPLTDVIIRHYVEKYYPGTVSMADKEKAARVMLAAFRMRLRIQTTFENVDLAEVLQEIEELTSPPAEEPPEIAS